MKATKLTSWHFVLILAAVVLFFTDRNGPSVSQTETPALAWEVYFSPHGGATSAIVKTLDQARKSILVQAYSFTSAPITSAIARAYKRGVEVQVILDRSQETAKYSAADHLINAGIKTFCDPGFADFLNQCLIPDEYRMTLMLYHHQCLQVTEHRKQLEKHFKAQLRPTPTVQLLMSLPGIGDITGSIIAMETGDIHRFADAKHYCSYCRLVPGARDSGGKHSHRSGSKDGNQYLKFAFTESAIKAMRFYPEIKHFASRLERRATKAIARTVVAKELAKISYYVLSRQEEFKTFKGIEINKLRNWPRSRKPVRLTGGAVNPPSV